MITYDVEIFPNVFTLSACEHCRSETMFTWEISFRRDDRNWLFQWFNYLAANQVEMIGFNNLSFDYPIIHFLYRNPTCTVADLYVLAQRIIASQNYDRFEFQVWQSERFAPQIDLYKIHHFDNIAKRTSLKALEFAMRSDHVLEMPVETGTVLTADQIDTLIVPYNRWDVRETDRFAAISEPNIEFRREMSQHLRGDVLNFNDTKIGKQLIEQRLGEELCFTRNHTGRKVARQTFRDRIALGDIIFPYIEFHHPEFRRILDYLKAQVITETKGVFSDVTANIDGFAFNFGTGGIHGSVASKVFRADDEHAIEDIDVAALYPSIAIENGLFPAHLGTRFVEVYRDIREERKKYKRGTVMNAALKLSANGAYGDSNNVYSVLYDPQFTMSITVNGQLLLCMLAEWLMTVPTLEIIQINTDGITYRIKRHHQATAKQIRDRWQGFTRLILEDAQYSRVFIRDVNNYCAETTEGKRKLKGAYWYPAKFPDDISNASPSAWYKDLSALVVPRAVEAAMFDGIPPEIFIPMWRDRFDFMIRAKVNRGSNLFIGDRPVQSMQRYYIARRGAPLRKVSPPVAGATPGDWKRKNGISDAEYHRIKGDLPAGQWDARIHTGNKSKYEDRETSFQAGWLVADCNVANDFNWSNVDYRWYIEEARKLIIT